MNSSLNFTISPYGRRYRCMEQVMASAGLNCCSKSASTNVNKDFKCFNEHEYPQLLLCLMLAVLLYKTIFQSTYPPHPEKLFPQFLYSFNAFKTSIVGV